MQERDAVNVITTLLEILGIQEGRQVVLVNGHHDAHQALPEVLDRQLLEELLLREHDPALQLVGHQLPVIGSEQPRLHIAELKECIAVN